MPQAPKYTLNWQTKALIPVLAFVFIMFPLLSHAGGLGFAPLAAIAGIAGYLLALPKINIRAIPLVFFALAVFLIWTVLTALWSPYEDNQTLINPVKLIVGVFLYSGGFLLSRHVTRGGRDVIRHALFASSVLTLGLLFIDQLSNYSLTDFFDPIKGGEHPRHKRNTNYMNLSHSITVLALISPLIVTLFLDWKKGGKVCAALWIILLVISTILGRLSAGLIAVIFASMMMISAHHKPKITLKILIAGAIASLIFAPLLGYMMTFVPETTKASMTDSWLHRVEIWGYTAEMVAQKPFFGHGFDAVRTFDRTFDFRALGTSNIMALHPHNAGLHIWVETGLIGVLLACSVLFFLGRFLLGHIEKFPSQAISIVGFLAAALIICSLTYGVWQEWWWGILCLIGVFISLAYAPSIDER